MKNHEKKLLFLRVAGWVGGRVAGSIGTNANSASVEVEVEVEVEAELGNISIALISPFGKKETIGQLK